MACSPLRIERDPAFWDRIASHPQVAHVTRGEQANWSFVRDSNYTPYAAEHGGFILCSKDPIGRVYELHTLFTPEGWGREVHSAALAMHEAMFAHADMLVTYETEHHQSRPPKSFGWQAASDMAPTQWGAMRTWFLTKDAWLQSPAWRRKCQHSRS